MRTNTIRTRWEAGEAVLSAWLSIPSAFSAEILAHTGFDCITIDTQHGLIDYGTAVAMLQAISTTDCIPLARVPWNDPSAIMKLLDAGVYGIVCPMVSTAQEAAAFAAACRYPPDGIRSWGPIRPSLADPGVGVRDGDMRAACIVMVETRAGVEHVEEIARVSGVDGILVGPADLGISLGGTPRETLTSEVNDASVRKIARACRDAGVAMGSLAPSPQRVEEYVRAGCRFVAAHRDLQSMMTAAVDALTVARETSTGPAER
jgi:4-hydroxy-2-oxoheptanedioate aldolase